MEDPESYSNGLDETSDSDMVDIEEEKNTEPQFSPFGIAPVDPLVFRESDDSPELRPGAAYVPAASRITARRPPPNSPNDRQEYPNWVPGGVNLSSPENITKKERQSPTTVLAKGVARTILVAVPLIFLLLLVLFATTILNR